MTTKTDTQKKITRELPVPMTEECVALRAQELAALISEKTTIETALAAFGADKRKRLREIRKDEKRLASAVSEKRELAMVDCLEHRRFSTNEIVVVRCDTGAEVEARTMKGEEKQREIDVDPSGETVDLDEADPTDEHPEAH